MGFLNTTSRTRSYVAIVGQLEVYGYATAELSMAANAQLGPISIRYLKWHSKYPYRVEESVNKHGVISWLRPG